MEMVKLKKYLNDFKTIEGVDDLNKIDWYLITDTGVMYSNLPPYNLIRLDEANDCLKIFKLEDQMGPTQTFAYSIITTETINTIGMYIRSKMDVMEVLNDYLDLDPTDTTYYIQDMFSDDFVINPIEKPTKYRK